MCEMISIRPLHHTVKHVIYCDWKPCIPFLYNLSFVVRSQGSVHRIVFRIIEKDCQPVEAQYVMDTMPDSLQCGSQITNLGDPLPKLEYFFEHRAAALLGFFGPLFVGDILHCTHNPCKAIFSIIPNWICVDAYPTQIAILSVHAQFRS